MSRLLRLSVGAAAGGSILLYALLVLLRIDYPFEIETFEGITADHVDRILQGLPIYTAPSLDFVPNIYPPLFCYLAAGLVWVFGVNLWVLCLIFVVSSLGCLVVLFAYVWCETGSRFCGVLSAGHLRNLLGLVRCRPGGGSIIDQDAGPVFPRRDVFWPVSGGGECVPRRFLSLGPNPERKRGIQLCSSICITN
jgi:hypothetical protein